MAQQIGELKSGIGIELTTIYDVLMIVVREPNGNAVMFPAYQLGDIQKILIKYLGAAYIKDTLKH